RAVLPRAVLATHGRHRYFVGVQCRTLGRSAPAGARLPPYDGISAGILRNPSPPEAVGPRSHTSVGGDPPRPVSPRQRARLGTRLQRRERAGRAPTIELPKPFGQSPQRRVPARVHCVALGVWTPTRRGNRRHAGSRLSARKSRGASVGTDLR